MGRKRKGVGGSFDRIGEPLNLEKCPACSVQTDCFACIDGKCTALNENGGQGCIFYKPYEEAVRQNTDAYRKLKSSKRFDLISKYSKAYVALGIEDDEFTEGAAISEELEAFEAADYTAQVKDAAEAEREGDG